VWFRRDLRLADHPALVQAIARGGPVIPVFLWAPDEEAPWAPGGAARWWLHHSLEALSASLTARGSHLILRKTDNSLSELRRLVAETGAGAVLWNRLYDPQLISRDKAIKAALRADGLDVESGSGALLFEPPAVKTQSGGPFQVFTPFWKHCLTLGDPPLPLEAPRHLPVPAAWPASQTLSSLDLLPRIGWDAAFSQHWTPGESGAWSALERFLEGPINQYDARRDRPDIVGTSRLSPHLHWGEITARQIWHASQPQIADPTPAGRSARKFLAEVGWREFAHHLLFHFPRTPEQPLRADFEKFPWVQNANHLTAWQRGRTGYPIVDAGMRELWTTGWMHNRVRMVVGSFLVKHLRIHWIEGARWFWDTLVDADLASNTLGWQWAAGCGADAAPYFRVFNPILQGDKFDPRGTYVRRWVPELEKVPAKLLNQPWELPLDDRAHLGIDYPDPIVDHREARAAALAAFEAIKRTQPVAP
jgi:deoxyribodipyrimidine photo-lyase